MRVTVENCTAHEGEDGHGNVVPSTRPVSIELENPDGWSGGALTTTLVVGALEFHNAGHPSPTTLRYLVADGNTLPRNTEVVLQYGPDPSRRRVVTASLPELR